ncbi:MAG: CoA-binding protein [Gammaproteobacteria bacterium]|nr:CoA-binding protein [Gammaproteobacteria bacterium]
MTSRFNLAHGHPERPQEHRVVVLGASPKSWRYSNQALRLLSEQGYRVVPVHPKIERIEGLAVTQDLRAIHDRVHTLTVYVGPARSFPLIEPIVRLKPGRVILNPGTESEDLEGQLHEHRIPYLHACTLVMLRTGQF